VAALELDHRPSSHEVVAGDLMPNRGHPKICDRTSRFALRPSVPQAAVESKIIGSGVDEHSERYAVDHCVHITSVALFDMAGKPMIAARRLRSQAARSAITPKACIFALTHRAPSE
jgi:hypothetical protein